LCDLALAMAKCTNEVDIYNLTKCLREQRPHMVNKMVKSTNVLIEIFTITQHFRKTIY
jgi:hypothetical protein